MAEWHPKATDSAGNEVTVVTVVRDGKVVTSAVRSTGNRERDEQRAREATRNSPQDSDSLKRTLGN